MKRIAVRLTTAVIAITISVLPIGCDANREQSFELSTEEMLSVLTGEKYMVAPEEIRSEGKKYRLVDIRSPADFAKGHLPNAVNIPPSDLLDQEFLKDLREANRIYLLYGGDQLEANGPWMVLRQLGIDNVKVLQGGYAYFDAGRAGLAEDIGYRAEEPRYNFIAVYEKAKKEHEAAIEAGKVKAPPPPPPKQIVPKKKKKVAEEEEGC